MKIGRRIERRGVGAGISPTAMDLPPRGAGIEGSKVNFVLLVGRTSPRSLQSHASGSYLPERIFAERESGLHKRRRTLIFLESWNTTALSELDLEI